ncbi:LysE family translocator [Haloarculaceae archaeon H-GB2-1]|nr:LysE family translocator [Haloarculaceae archaeon H-GB1-1]MEA5407083.1 LysE family translocator [Haloarculaceae archaeon H-GB2-1]
MTGPLPLGFSTNALALFLGASVALVLTPGPDTMYVLTRGVADGRAAGLQSALGVSTGILVHTTAAVLGLAALLRVSELGYALVKYVGAAYLLYLGVQTIRQDDALSSADSSADGGSFRQGVAVNVLNPKVALFFLAFLPQFVTAKSAASLQMVALGLLYAVLTVAYLGTVGVLSGRIGTALRRRDRVRSAIQWGSGTVLAGLAVRLAVGDSLG